MVVETMRQFFHGMNLTPFSNVSASKRKSGSLAGVMGAVFSMVGIVGRIDCRNSVVALEKQESWKGARAGVLQDFLGKVLGKGDADGRKTSKTR